MIGRLHGIVLDKRPPYLLLEVQGVGYDLEASLSTFAHLPEVGQAATLYTHLAIREDIPSLYGFMDVTERQLFRELLKVAGVGPRSALLILSGMTADRVVHCIQSGDTATLMRLPGIGKKTAERLVLELRDRLTRSHFDHSVSQPPPTVNVTLPTSPREEAISALMALGYSTVEATRLVHHVFVEGLASEALIRRALQATIHK